MRENIMKIKTKYANTTLKKLIFHENGEVKKEKYSDGTVVDRDERGNEIHFKDPWGKEVWHSYDKKGNETYYRSNDGYESWTEYDRNGKKAYKSYEKIIWGDYDGYVDDDEDKVDRETWYDDRGNEIHKRTLDGGFECWTEYNANNEPINYKDNWGQTMLWEYDERNRVTYFKTEKFEKWTTYDEEGFPHDRYNPE